MMRLFYNFRSDHAAQRGRFQHGETAFLKVLAENYTKRRSAERWRRMDGLFLIKAI